MLRTFIVAALRWIQSVLEPSDEEDFLAERKVDLSWERWYHQMFYQSNECDDSDAVVSVGHKTDRCLPVFLKDRQESFNAHGSQLFEYIDSGATIAKYSFATKGCPPDGAIADPSVPRRTVEIEPVSSCSQVLSSIDGDGMSLDGDFARYAGKNMPLTGRAPYATVLGYVSLDECNAADAYEQAYLKGKYAVMPASQRPAAVNASFYVAYHTENSCRPVSSFEESSWATALSCFHGTPYLSVYSDPHCHDDHLLRTVSLSHGCQRELNLPGMESVEYSRWVCVQNGAVIAHKHHVDRTSTFAWVGVLVVLVSCLRWVVGKWVYPHGTSGSTRARGKLKADDDLVYDQDQATTNTSSSSNRRGVARRESHHHHREERLQHRQPSYAEAASDWLAEALDGLARRVRGSDATGDRFKASASGEALYRRDSSSSSQQMLSGEKGRYGDIPPQSLSRLAGSGGSGSGSGGGGGGGDDWVHSSSDERHVGRQVGSDGDFRAQVRALDNGLGGEGVPYRRRTPGTAHVHQQSDSAGEYAQRTYGHRHADSKGGGYVEYDPSALEVLPKHGSDGVLGDDAFSYSERYGHHGHHDPPPVDLDDNISDISDPEDQDRMRYRLKQFSRQREHGKGDASNIHGSTRVNASASASEGPPRRQDSEDTYGGKGAILPMSSPRAFSDDREGARSTDNILGIGNIPELEPPWSIRGAGIEPVSGSGSVHKNGEYGAAHHDSPNLNPNFDVVDSIGEHTATGSALEGSVLPGTSTSTSSVSQLSVSLTSRASHAGSSIIVPHSQPMAIVSALERLGGSRPSSRASDIAGEYVEELEESWSVKDMLRGVPAPLPVKGRGRSATLGSRSSYNSGDRERGWSQDRDKDKRKTRESRGSSGDDRRRGGRDGSHGRSREREHERGLEREYEHDRDHRSTALYSHSNPRSSDSGSSPLSGPSSPYAPAAPNLLRGSSTDSLLGSFGSVKEVLRDLPVSAPGWRHRKSESMNRSVEESGRDIGASGALLDIQLPNEQLEQLTAPAGNPVLKRVSLDSFRSPISRGSRGSEMSPMSGNDHHSSPYSQQSQHSSPHSGASSNNEVNDVELGARRGRSVTDLGSSDAGKRVVELKAGSLRAYAADPIMDPMHPDNSVPGVPLRVRTYSSNSTGTNSSHFSYSGTDLDALPLARKLSGLSVSSASVPPPSTLPLSTGHTVTINSISDADVDIESGASDVDASFTQSSRRLSHGQHIPPPATPPPHMGMTFPIGIERDQGPPFDSGSRTYVRPPPIVTVPINTNFNSSHDSGSASGSFPSLPGPPSTPPSIKAISPSSSNNGPVDVFRYDDGGGIIGAGTSVVITGVVHNDDINDEAMSLGSFVDDADDDVIEGSVASDHGYGASRADYTGERHQDRDESGELSARFEAAGSLSPSLVDYAEGVGAVSDIRRPLRSQEGSLEDVLRTLSPQNHPGSPLLSDDEDESDADSAIFLDANSNSFQRSPSRTKAPVQGLHTKAGENSRVVGLLSHLSRSASGGSGGDGEVYDPSEYSPFSS